jgi:hypothetical protein
VTGAEHIDSDTKNKDITGAMFVYNDGKDVFLCQFRQGFVLAIDLGWLMGDPTVQIS